MHLLVYVSSATSPFSDKQLLDLLEHSRRKNHQSDITGMLLYKEGNFMQVLEGSKETIQSLLAKIKRDPRHRGLLVLLQQERAGREFDEWAMGFQKLDSETVIEVPGYKDFLELPLTSEQFQVTPSKALKLLLSFRKVCRS